MHRLAVLFILCILPGMGFAQFSEEAEEPANYIKKSIYFGGGSYQIDSWQARELHNFIDSLVSIDAYEITIHSYTDNIGGAEYNAWLSDMRSRAVIYLLLQKAIPLHQIENREFGQYNPIYDNSTWEGRRLNRRVDIIFWPLAM
ncbi:MAG TPA: hypothetical protein DCE41_03705 [Cytophagales bacterium]|nr:hypothetical protein [Cytophagales bacterium]HAA21627.1 hypothetical protein [Cytophagales bacterium]HAP62853.1 hypothetical protein [Cytophagales bacterium]